MKIVQMFLGIRIFQDYDELVKISNNNEWDISNQGFAMKFCRTLINDRTLRVV